jgi:uncharacterized protein YdeI (YjbR/CyaY-like superfamily)
MAMITDVETYFAKGCGRCARFDTPDCSTKRWPGALGALRDICRGAGLVETAKWGHPCYMHAGRNVAILGAFRDDVRMTFFEAGLLDDPEGLLERQGPNTRVPDAVRFRDDAAPARMAPALRALLAQAMAHAAAGRRAPRDPAEIDLPEEMTEALDADPALAEAFAALTPGRQRSYAIALASAKTSATRVARIARFRDRILAGRGATER